MMLLKARLILIIVLCIALFAGCSAKSNTSAISESHNNSIVGYWEGQSFDNEIFIEFREDRTFTTNLKVLDLSQDDGIYTSDEGVLRLYYISRNEVDEQTNTPIEGSLKSDSIYLYKVADSKLYLAMWIGFDPDRSIDDIIDAQDEGLMYFSRVVV